MNEAQLNIMDHLASDLMDALTWVRDDVPLSIVLKWEETLKRYERVRE